jgi:1-deoxy-D-xylulose-5-phosphate synthase
MLHRVPMGAEISEAIKNIKAGLKTTIHGDQVFEALGFEYFGPVDGHDIGGLIRILRRMAEAKRPVLLHIHTQKGRGAQYAVEDPCRFHSPSAYTIREGKAVFPEKQRPTWTKVFGDIITELGRDDPRIVAITAAMADGAGLVKFRKEFPSRYIDVGISESHAAAMAGGLAKAGMRPIVAVYSTFMQRAFDQVFQEVCLQGLPVLLCMDRAGLVGSDGAVHHGFSDIATLRTLPGMTLMAPADEAELKSAMQLALSLDSPAAIRYPRDEVSDCLGTDCPPFELGRARIVRGSSAGDTSPGSLAKADATFLCYGAMVESALAAADILQQEGIAAAVVNARYAKPLDAPLISRLTALGKPILCVEDHSVIGGFGSAVLELASSRGLNASNVRIAGIPDRFISYASRQQQLAECGLDETSLAEALREMIRHPAETLTKRYQ